ncbi:MAG: ATP-dependent DNA helicase RecG [Candidatus Omnitrophica bacterium]|nr:ATP-dependent DNA helicase RecG [Candidatus Omnitrophota bacterium]MDD5429813.1 ATP-dependent DNA helicase RecG [Candidatus Omnitrophota bacterium]
MHKTPIRYLKGVGPRREAVFNKIGIFTVKDLLYYFPFRYQDRRFLKKISTLRIGEFAVVRAKVKTTNIKKFPYFLRSKKIKSIFEAILEDETGFLECVWFNQAYLAEAIKPGEELTVYGKLYFSKKGTQFISPEYEISGNLDSPAEAKITGVYHAPEGLNQKFIRKIVSAAIKQYISKCIDPLPFYIRQEKNIMNIAKSFEEIHFPSSWLKAAAARERFIFEELFFSQISVFLRKARRIFQKSVSLKIEQDDFKAIDDNLGFDLTAGQAKAVSQILSDIAKPYPMHRLLQGDVGCGKTIAAAFSIGACYASGLQAAFMVPTEILAYQHFETLRRIFKLKAMAFRDFESSIKIITSSLSRKEKDVIYEDLSRGTLKVIVGTHALIQEKVKFKNLGLVVIDEQHRFGVAQRALLSNREALSPHCLVMSATPIPRSLALSLYGDLDLSVIKDMPQGRKPPVTMWVKEDKRQWVYDFLEKELKSGHQAYIVYPVIDDSPDEELKSLKVMFEKITKRFSEFKPRMFHGRMKNEEKLTTIKEFREKKSRILVSTTVIEVGVDIKEATVMVIESPERFGLAQLHQLRGRIQRSEEQAYFVLISSKELSENASERLRVISQTHDGFVIAEEDLKSRGPGDFFGNLQHGLPDLRIANPLRDMDLLNRARSLAYKVIKSDPGLNKKEHSCINEHLNN